MVGKTGGNRGDVRKSALWGSGNRGGELRSNALWGKGGRGFVVVLALTVALSVPVSGVAASGGKSKGNGKVKVTVPASPFNVRNGKLKVTAPAKVKQAKVTHGKVKSGKATHGKVKNGKVKVTVPAVPVEVTAAVPLDVKVTATVPAAFLAEAQASPNQVFRVIVQGTPGEGSRAVAKDVASGNGAIEQKFVTISGVAANLSGADLLKLAQNSNVLAITPDVPLHSALLGPLNTVLPTMSGTAEEGQTLTADAGTWTGTDPIDYAYQWQRCDTAGLVCADIVDATSATYVAAAADVGSTLAVVVTTTDSNGSNAAGSAPSAVVAGAIAADTITAADLAAASVAAADSVVAAETSTAAADSAAVIDSAVTSTEIAPEATVAADAVSTPEVAAEPVAPAEIAVADVAAAEAAPETSVAPDTTAEIAPEATVADLAPELAPPVADTVAPAISGPAMAGKVITAATGSWTTSGGPISYAYQWQRCDSAGLCADIAGATKASYTLLAADVGKSNRVVVTATNADGSSSAKSDVTAAVAGLVSNYLDAEMWRASTHVDLLWNNLDLMTGEVIGAAPQAPAIAIVDSGIDASKVDDFGGRVIASVNMSSLDPNSSGDPEGHGTMVAGIAAGASPLNPGVAPNAPIVDVRTADANGQSMTSDVIAAADWILAHKDEYNIRVANFSMAGAVATSFRFDPLDKAVEKLWFSGVVVVAAAGNHGSDTSSVDMSYAPGNDPFIITVGALDQQQTTDPLDDVVPGWSAYGHTLDGFAKPDLSAPGRYMVAPVPMNATIPNVVPERVVAAGYMWMSGTSFSAPVVSGAAAQILARHPDWTPNEVKGALMLTSAYLDGAGFSGGVGEVDAATAASLDFSPPNPNENLDAFIVADPATGTSTFDEASWSSTVAADASWSSASWSSAIWQSASWSSASWSSASWSSASWSSNVDAAMQGLVSWSSAINSTATNSTATHSTATWVK